MLLLLLSPDKFRIKDLFEVWQGITTNRDRDEYPAKKKMSAKYKVVNLSSINDCTGMITSDRLVDYTPARNIPEEKLLTKNDYLISCKGEVKGFSMINSQMFFETKKNTKTFPWLAASNHYLVLRPRMLSGIGHEEIIYLHNLLSIFIPELDNLARSRPGNTKYLTLNDVANYKIRYPDKRVGIINEFNRLFNEYSEKLGELNDIKGRLDEFNRSLASKIIIPQDDPEK
ncbi:MAG TPA: hypothetical protein PLV06_14680 [Bacteroidales bacterium]|nr:hypothetical protein [Bacteroidales bacterium]